MGVAQKPSMAVVMKRPHTGQVKPSRPGTSEASRIGRVPPTGLGLAHAERLPFSQNRHAVVEQPVEEADRSGVLGQEAAPVLERPVRADAERPALVGPGDETEEQLGPGGVQRGEADLVQLSRHRHSWTYADVGIDRRAGICGP